MNKTELYSDLSYNPSTDFETLLMESLIDDAEAESFAAHAALESYLESKETDSFTDALESLMIVLEGDKEDCEKKCKEKEEDEEEDEKKESEDDEDEDDEEDEEDEEEDAEEATLRAACEAADASLGQKIAAAWKHFVEKVKAFLTRIAESMKNIATKFSAKMAEKMAGKNSDVKVKILKSQKDNLNAMSDFVSLFNSLNADNAKQISDEISNKLKAHNANNGWVEVSANEIKSWMGTVSATLKSATNALKKVDAAVNTAIRDGEPDARAKMADSRSAITNGMSAIRTAVSDLTKAISDFVSDKKETEKKAKKDERAATKAQKAAQKAAKNNPEADVL